jgi:hypothetical protein
MMLTLSGIRIANLTGGAGNNTFTVNGWTGTATLDGNGGANTYRLNMSGVGIITLQHTGTPGNDVAVVTAGPGSDPFNISATRTTHGAETVHYTGGLKSLQVIAGAGNDIFNVTSSPDTTITVDGGPGSDRLNFDATGLNLSIGATSLTSPGRQPVFFTDVECLNVTPATPATRADSYARRLYRDVLNRIPDPDGLKFWVQQVLNGTPHETIARTFWESREHRGLQVDQFYNTVLNRAADPSGREFWQNVLLSGVGELDVEGAFLMSAEYGATHASDGAFVQGLYQSVLGRAPDNLGAAGWVTNLQRGGGRDLVSQIFLNSEESRRRIIDAVYTQYLHRHPGAAEAQTWLLALAGSRSPVNAVNIGVLASDEYFKAEC